MFLEAEYLNIVKAILKENIPNYKVWAFGSRVTQKHLKKFSDLDLVIITSQKIDFQEYAKIKNAFSDSNLPFMVDILDWSTLTPEFKKIIKTAYTIIQ